MKTLADIVLDYFWFLNFSSDEELDNDIGVQLLENVSYEIEHELSGRRESRSESRSR